MYKIMTKHIVALIILTVSAITASATPGIIARADSAYNADNYQLALELYTQDPGYKSSPELLYNIGNAYYRLGDLGHAILYFERALKIDPTFSDAKTNLDFVNTKIIDEKQSASGSFLSNASHDIAMTASANTWAVITLILFIITAAAISLYIFSGNIIIRKTGFFGAITTFILFLISLVFAIYSYSFAHSHDEAIITAPSTILSTKPRAPQSRTEEAMLLHQGTKISILDSINTYDSNGNRWFDVRIDNNHRAWIKDTDIERI